MPAGALVDRADVQAGRAADAAQRLAPDVVGEHAVRPLSSSTTCTSCGPSPGVTPGPGRGVGVHPLAGRRARQQPAGTRRGRARSARTFSMPTTETSTSGRVRHIRPLPSDSTTTSVPVSATAKFAPETATLARRNFSRRCSAGRRGQAARLVGQVVGRRPADRRPSRAGRSRGSRRGCGGSPAPGCGWARSSPSCTMSSARSVSQAAIPSAASASLSSISWVAIDLTLTTSVGAVARRPGRRRCGWPRRRRAPSARWRPAAVSVASSCSRWSSRSQQRLVLDAARRPARSCLPVVHLADDAGALVADGAGGVRQVCAAAGCCRAPPAPPSGTSASRRRRRSLRRADGRHAGPPRWPPGSRPGAWPARRCAAATAARRCASGTSCRRRPGPRRRCRARGGPCRRPSPPTCRRSSPRRCRRSPQHSSAAGRSTRSIPRTAPSSRSGRSPTRSIRSE